jgi:uncharacterized protein with gpF-like domain
MAKKKDYIGTGVPAPKTQIKAFAAFTQKMVNEMADQYKNQALKSLDKSTIRKFADAQTGNYASVFLSLSDAARKKIMARFSDERIEQAVKEILKKVSNYNADATYKDIAKMISIDPKLLFARERLTPEFNALMDSTTEWVKTLRNNILQDFANNAITMMTTGASMTEVLKNFDLNKSKKSDAARFTAHQQVTMFNSLSSKLRYQNLGITEAIWQTAGDGDRVRVAHQDRSGKRFDLAKGLYSAVDKKTILPGIDYGCRCRARPVLPAEFAQQFLVA